MCDITASTSQAPRPKWWLLYALLAVVLALFAAVAIVSPAGGWRTLAQCVSVVVIFGAMAAWVRSNRVALDQADWCACAAEKVTVRVIHSHPVAPEPVQPAERVPVRLQQVGLHKVHPVEPEEAECVSTLDQL